MKKYIYIVIVLIGCTLIAYFPLEMSIEKNAQSKIEEDSVQYRLETIQQLDEIFKGKEIGGFGCVLYYNFIPNYISTTPQNLGGIYSSDEGEKLFQFHELKTLYMLSPSVDLENINMQGLNDAIMLNNADIGERDNLFKPINGNQRKVKDGFWQSGWAIGYAVRIDDESYAYQIIHPNIVGSLNGTMTSFEISEALESTLNYYLTNRRSQYYGYINDEYVSDFMRLALCRIGASLYHFENDSTIGQGYYAFDCIDVGNSRVYITCSNKKGYILKYCNEFDGQVKSFYIEEHCERLIMIISIVLGVLFFLLVILLIINVKERKRINQTVLQRIIRKSTPRLYLKKYDSKKVEIANIIYNKALTTKEGDESAILELCDQAEKELGIILIEKSEKRDLLNKSNPKNFTKPYNAEKLAKANSLYASLRKGETSYRKFVELRNEVNKLYDT